MRCQILNIQIPAKIPARYWISKSQPVIKYSNPQLDIHLNIGYANYIWILNIQILDIGYPNPIWILDTQILARYPASSQILDAQIPFRY